jgi:hypothetical protein
MTEAGGDRDPGPRLVRGHVGEDLEPRRYGDRHTVPVVDLGEQRAVLELVHGDADPVSLDVVPTLAEK